jgi:uncharacterized membrane protein
MKELLIVATENAVVVIYGMALLVIVIGTIEAFVSAFRALISPPTLHERSDIWLRFARWLVAGLTFQLAGDILETSITTSWEAVGRLAAIAGVRTFLNYFLDRDVKEVRRQRLEKESQSLSARS